MKWKKGRQGEGYEVLTLISSKWLGIDLHIIYYPPFGEIPPHKDEVKGKRHYRLNFVLKGKGYFKCHKYSQWWRFVYFRPDLYTHAFKNLNKSRYVVSLGWVKNEL